MGEIMNFGLHKNRKERGETYDEQKHRLLNELYLATIEASNVDIEDPVVATLTFDDFLSVNPRFKTMTIEEIQKEIQELEETEE